MSLDLFILEDVAKELSAISLWYEEQQAGLGNQFQEEFYRILQHISDYSESGVRYKKIIVNHVF